MDTWEYSRIRVGSGYNDLSELNELGRQGWEAIGIDTGTILLKRKTHSSPAPAATVAKTAQRPVRNQRVDDDYEINF